MKRIPTLTLCLVFLFAASAALAQSVDSTAIDQREANQQQRIQQGISSGQLSPKEATRLERQEGRIAAQEDRMKADGKLSKAERARLNREQNRESKRIYRQKHDAQKATPAVQ
jgi:hypothetical protein